MIAIAAAIAVYAPQLGLAALHAFGVTAAAGSGLALAATAVASAVLGIAATAVLGALAGKPSTGTAEPSVFRQSVANSIIIYGKRRVGGLLIFFHPVGKDYRYFVIAAAGHRCKGVTRWLLGDEVVTVDGSGMVTSGTYAKNAWLWFARGTDDQVANATFVAETQGKWTANHRGRGTALIYAKFKMVDAVVQAGMPNITAEIEGKDDVKDPRDDSAGYTRNAALVFYDWLAMPREEGGFGAYPDELDEDWTAAQAQVADEACPLPDGTTEARYAFDSFIQTGAAPSEIRDTFVTCCAGAYTYSGGKHLMRVGQYVSPSATLQERDLAGAITVPAILSDDETATEVSGTYVEADKYQQADVPTRSVDGGGDVRQKTYDLPHVTSIYRSQRILEYYLRKALAERRVTWPMNIVGIGISTLDTVQLATARYGLSNYSFQVTSWGLSADFSVALQMEEHGPEMFEFDVGDYLAVGATGELMRADPISDTDFLPAGVHMLAAQSVDFPITSDGASITIAAFSGRLDSGSSIDFPAATITGLSAGTRYVVTWSLSHSAYAATPAPASVAMGSSDNVYLGTQSTANADGSYPSVATPPDGYVSGGSYSKTGEEA
ncbi:phage tail protein [Sphingomonas bacterium]|uniref:phage tail protein n=1 Tax=Sphingomonas bacterium TaxID=1895847 RepID=UPI001576940D|nr:phage tail protein [Sphingomonas bacterium]